MVSKDGKITPSCILLPLSLLAFVVFIMLAFQTSQILRDRDSLHQAKEQQEKPLAETQKVQAQLNALAVGTLKLSQAGDKSAKVIIDRMKQLGITVNSGAKPEANTKAPSASVPAAAR